MAKRLEGVHMGFLRKFTEKTAQWQWDGMWKKEREASVLRETGTHTLREYTKRHKTTVAKWVALRPIY